MNKPAQYLINLFILPTVILFSSVSSAHSRFVLPTHTSLSGAEPQWVSLDLSISNDFFHPDMAYGGTSDEGDNFFAGLQLQVKDPSGAVYPAQDLVNLGRKSVTAVQIDKDGTYQLRADAPSLLVTTFKTAAGSPGRVFEGDELPEGVTDVAVWRSSNRAETYVTKNSISFDSLVPTGEGIELGEGSHPNDLFAGEDICFQFLMDGEPVAEGHEVMIVRDGTRHRNSRSEIPAITDAEGRVSFQFPEGGFYFIELIIEQEASAGLNYDFDYHTYSATLEVWPE